MVIIVQRDLSGPMRHHVHIGQLFAVAARCPLHKLMSTVKTEVETAWK